MIVDTWLCGVFLGAPFETALPLPIERPFDMRGFLSPTIPLGRRGDTDGFRTPDVLRFI